MASQAQRQFQEERSSRNTGWSQLVNRNLDFMDDSATEEMPAASAPGPRIVRTAERQATGDLRRSSTTTYAAPTQQVSKPRPSFDLGGKFAGAGDRFGQAKPIMLAGGFAVAVIVTYLLISSAVGFMGSRMDNLGYLCDQACTTHVEAFVGHESSGLPSHFLAINLHGQITVVEFPGSDPSKAMTITGPYLFGKGEDKVPVQLEISDLNGDGKSDLVISAKGAQTAYINDGTAFRAMKPEERASVERALGNASSTAAAQPVSGSAAAPAK